MICYSQTYFEKIHFPQQFLEKEFQKFQTTAEFLEWANSSQLSNVKEQCVCLPLFAKNFSCLLVTCHLSLDSFQNTEGPISPK